MKWSVNSGRTAGFLYLLVVIVGAFELMYVPGKLYVHGDVTATISNLVTHESLFRLGMVAALWSGILMLFLALALYRVFKEVDRRLAVLMVILGGVLLVAADFSILCNAAALMLAKGAEFLSVFEKPQREALAMMFMRLNTQQIYAAEIFWGLWLFPLGVLVYKSGSVPRLLGIWLIINGCAYLVESFAGLLIPQYENALTNLLFPVQLGEVAFMLWLLIMGVKQPAPRHPDALSMQKART